MKKQKKSISDKAEPIQKKINNQTLHLIFLILLIFSIGFRLSLLPALFRLDDGDTARDHMIARHIALYREYPTIGINNAIYDSVRASPLYYYLLSIPILIHDNIYSIGVLNILLQALSTISLYFLALVLFGQTTAILTGILLLCNQELFSQSFYMIQAHFGHVFFNGSYLFLAISYIHKSRRLLYISTTLFALGCIISFHGFPALIGYLIINFFVLRSQKASISQIVSLYSTMALLGIFSYAPVLINLLTTNNASFLVKEPVYIREFTDLPIRIISNVRLAMDDWVTSLWLSVQVKNILLSILSLNLIRYLIWTKEKSTKNTILVMLAYIFQVGFLAAMLRLKTNSYQYDSITGLTIVLLAFTAASTWPKNFLGRIARWLSIICLIVLVIPTHGYIQWQQSQKNQQQKIELKLAPLYTYLDNQKSIHPSDWNEQFQIAMYNGRTNSYHWKESVIWNALEHRYDMPFIRAVNYGYNYAPLTTNEKHYILICEEYTSVYDASDRCVSSFTEAHQGAHYSIQILSDNSPFGYILFSAELGGTK